MEGREESGVRGNPKGTGRAIVRASPSVLARRSPIPLTASKLTSSKAWTLLVSVMSILLVSLMVAFNTGIVIPKLGLTVVISALAKLSMRLGTAKLSRPA